MNKVRMLLALGAIGVLAGCGDTSTLDPVGVYPEPELQPGPTSSPLAGNEPGLDPLVEPGVNPVEPVL